MNTTRPLVGVTVGDAAGVGPELALGLAERPDVVVYGRTDVLRAAAADLARRGLAAPSPSSIVRVATPGEARSVGAGLLPVIDVATVSAEVLAPYPWGQAVAAFGALQHAALVAAIDDAQAGHIDAICTAPWHKHRLADAGLPPTGHTEVLESQTGADRAVMVLAGDVLRVALATSHLPLRDVADALTVDSIVDTAATFADGLQQLWGIDAPRIALCGVNPHAGEGGVLGHEDTTIVAPAVERLRALGVDASGPWPADTLFPRVVAGRMACDGVVAMYHDQGLGPLKTAHFGEAANITLGLPIVRTSVDHGTAYDIAGTGTVDRSSFDYALGLARTFAARRAG